MAKNDKPVEPVEEPQSAPEPEQAPEPVAAVKQADPGPQVVMAPPPVIDPAMYQVGSVCTECAAFWPEPGRVWCPSCKGKTVDGTRAQAKDIAAANAKSRGIG